MARIRFGIYLHEGGPKIGRGKIRLLMAVRDLGSIAAAARSMEMAYRRAWVLLDELNRSFSEPVITSTMGGQNRGGAQLTRWGLELIERFEEIDRLTSLSAADHLDAIEAQLAQPSRPRRRRRARPPASDRTRSGR